MCSSTPTSRPGAGSPASRYRRPRRWCGFRVKANGDAGGKANGFRPIPEWRSRSPECFSKAQRRWTSYRHNEPARWCSRGGRPASRSRGLVFVRIADQPLAVRLPGGRRAKIRARSRGAECGRSRIGWFFSRLRFSRNSRLFGYTGCSGAAPSRSPGALSCRWSPLPNSTRPPTACPQAAARAAQADHLQRLRARRRLRLHLRVQRQDPRVGHAAGLRGRPQRCDHRDDALDLGGAVLF